MALPGVLIEIQGGGLGQPPATADGVVGILLQGPAVVDGIQVAAPVLFTSLAAAETAGITAAYDTANTVRVHKHLREFFEAGGQQVWVMLVSQAVAMVDMADPLLTHAPTLLNAAQGTIRVLGITRSPSAGYTPNTTANHIDLDVVNAIAKAQALVVSQFAKIAPIRVVLEARHYTGTSASLVNLKARTDNGVAVLLADSVTGGGGAVGLLLGRIASIPVQRNVGRVKSLALPNTTAFVGANSVATSPAEVTTIHDKGFITMRTHVRKAGFFFTDDPTATSATDDYNSLARGRVVDKMAVLAYDVYVEEILDEIEIDAQGRIEASKAKYYQAIIERAINDTMVVEAELSSVRVVVDPAQNVLATGRFRVQLRGRPVGYAKEIVVELGFENPANNA